MSRTKRRNLGEVGGVFVPVEHLKGLFYLDGSESPGRLLVVTEISILLWWESLWKKNLRGNLEYRNFIVKEEGEGSTAGGNGQRLVGGKTERVVHRR